MAYKDWERKLRKRRFMEGLSVTIWSAPWLLGHLKHGQHIAALRNPGAASRGSSRSRACVGFRWLQHQLNALHLMSLLVRWGVPRSWALAVARRWENVSHSWLYAPGSELPPNWPRLRDQ